MVPKDDIGSINEVKLELNSVKQEISGISQFLQGQKAEGKEGDTGNKENWAEKAGKNLPAMIASVVAEEVGKQKEVEDREKCVIIDDLPVSDGESPEKAVKEFLGAVGVEQTTAHSTVALNDRQNEGGQKLYKIKCRFENADIQKEVLEKGRKSKPRQGRFSQVFVNPSRSSEERRRLFLLRKRRDFLNVGKKEKEIGWVIIDYRYSKLACLKGNGRVNWQFQDDGFEEWASEFERQKSENQKRGRGGEAASSSDTYVTPSKTPNPNPTSPPREA